MSARKRKRRLMRAWKRRVGYIWRPGRAIDRG